MPVHDWTRVEAGIFHDFHHAWIEEIKRALNAGLLPEDYYALAEQHAAGFGPDVLTLQTSESFEAGPGGRRSGSGSGGAVGLLPSPPPARLAGETELGFYRRKQNTVAIRHVSGDRVVAMVEIVSRGNKSGRLALDAFVQKAGDLLEHGVHLLILDLHPPGRHDPLGIHGAIWSELTGLDAEPPQKPFTLAAYERAESIRAYVEHIAVGDALPDMPLFLEPRAYINLPLEKTYGGAVAGVPQRWRSVLEQREAR